MSTLYATKKSRQDKTAGNSDFSMAWLLGSAALFVAVVLLLLWYFDAHEYALQMLEWIERQGVWSAIWFISIMALVVILLIPGVLFTTGAGFVFGVLTGTLYVVLGTTIGATIAFLIARYLFGERAKNAILSNRKLHAITTEAQDSDFRIVLLTRLIPFFPFKLSNYLFGLSGFSFTRYVAATFLGSIPFSLHNVYLGSIAADITNIGTRDVARTPMEWSFYGLGFAATIIALFYFNRVARRALASIKD